MNTIIKFLLIVTVCFSGYSSVGQRSKTISFVQLCDTQLGMGGYDHDKKTFESAVKKINLLNPDFVIICGDLVNTPNDSSYADFNKIAGMMKIPLFCVPGNHDVGGKDFLKSLEFYRRTMKKDYYSFCRKGLTFIGVNTQLWKTGIGQESSEHDLWFKKTLQKAGKRHKPVIVFGHSPLFIADPQEKEAYFNLSLQKRKELLDLFKDNSVSAYLSGHSHTTILNNYKGIQLVSGETTSKNFDKHPLGFRLWTVKRDSLSQKFVPLED
jgi:DNA repair exonuclease SbcCD nuclease subunit